jgi:hypothetical protein
MRFIAHLRAGFMVIAMSVGLMAAPQAQADFIPGGYQIGSQQFGLPQGTFSAGGFKGTWNSTPIIFWCIELTQTFSFGEHFTTYVPSAASNALLSKLFSAAYGSALGSTQNSAAFQLAIWEIIYDGSNLNLSDGGFKVLDNKGNGATVTIAQGYLNSVTGASANYSLVFLNEPNHQDFVTANAIPTTTTTSRVPEPGSLALIGIALVAAGFTRGRNARAVA